MPLRRVAPPSGWFPRRGEVCLFALDKKRPAVIVSSNALNRHARDVCVAPLTTAEHAAFTVRPKLRAGEVGLSRDSWVKCDQLITVAKSLAVYPPLGTVGRDSMRRIEEAVKKALDLP